MTTPHSSKLPGQKLARRSSVRARRVFPILLVACVGLELATGSAFAQNAPPPPLSGPNPALLPQSRRTVQLQINEPNPFGQQAEKGRQLVEETQETEEVVLRRTIGGMTVGGLSGGEGNFTVLVGSLRMRAGDNLPPILPRQLEKLRVETITDKVVLLGFLEKDGKVGDRTFTIPITKRPVVRYMLPSQTDPIPPPEISLQGVFVPPANDSQ